MNHLRPKRLWSETGWQNLCTGHQIATIQMVIFHCTNIVKTLAVPTLLSHFHSDLVILLDKQFLSRVYSLHSTVAREHWIHINTLITFISVMVFRNNVPFLPRIATYICTRISVTEILIRVAMVGKFKIVYWKVENLNSVLSDWLLVSTDIFSRISNWNVG